MTEPQHQPPPVTGPRDLQGGWGGPVAVILVATLQTLCGVFFVYDLAASIFGWRDAPVSWSWHEALEIMATTGLLLGMAMGAILTATLLRQRKRAADRLRAASSEFHGVVQDRFAQWRLTPSERDVALFMLKGFANSEIAELRKTSEGTIKAQSNAVFRKAGVSGRAQYLGLFIEDLL
ncbi:MAG: LuxR C-terminal-related transcriptional regulator [Pseudomonadota bacterium]